MDEPVKQTAKQRRRAAAQRRRTHNVLLAFAFLGFLLICFVINLCVRDKEFSDTENRSLAQKPSLTWETVADGSYFSGLTTYFSDQFFARDGWISIKLWEDSLLGRKEAGGVYLGKNDYLIGQPNEADPEASENLVSAINQFAQRYPNASMQVMAVPMAASVLSDYLPNHAPVPDQLQALQELQGKFSSSIVQLDAVTPLMSHVEEEIYYKTDHHWTSLGAYYTFCANSTAMGITGSTSEYDVYTVTDSFEGTLSSKSGSHSAMDHIEIYAPKNSSVEYYVTYPDSQDKVCSIFRSDCLEVKDKYTVFFGGNHSIVEIKTTANNGKNLLLFKDSYANCFVQFLIPHYENIIMVDPRYYYDNVDSIMNNQGITDVLFLYCADTILTDTSLTDVLTAGTQNDAPLTEALTETPAVTEEIPVDGSAAEGSVVEESIIEGSVLP